MARQNVLEHGLAERVYIVQGCGTLGLQGTFDGIISNPPYIPSDQVDRLPLDVSQEPRLSLDGGPDGLRLAHQLIVEAAHLLRPDGIMAIECAEAQQRILMDQARSASWTAHVIGVRDLTQRARPRDWVRAVHASALGRGSITA